MQSTSKLSPLLTPEQKKIITRRNFLGFATLGVGALGGILGWNWVRNQPKVGETGAPLRSMLENNGTISENVLFSRQHLAPEYPRASAAAEPRTNGDIGLDDDMEADEWKMTITAGKNAKPLEISLAEILALPKTEIVFDFKCVEGWSEVQHWGGIRLSELFRKYGISTDYRYVGMATPDKAYYVGLDMASALHPQTLLAYQSNGATISQEQGFPLRLIVPVKYGIKNIKRIGSITLTNERPPDYWAEQGYDYYAGL
jgi:DMSO/TMAO reductase YedYZ molybdopterin-dependent catalytic subunit